MKRIAWGADHRIALAKWYGKRHGMKGNKGGWIHASYTDGLVHPRPVAQGWLDLYNRRRYAIWDELNAQG